MNRRSGPDLEQIRSALGQRDLTDPAQGEHPLQRLIEDIHEGLAREWNCARQVYRGTPVIAAPPEGPHIADTGPALGLRRSMTAHLPALVGSLAYDPPADLLMVLPGRVHGADGSHHELVLLRLVNSPLAPPVLAAMAGSVRHSAVPGSRYRLLSAGHTASERGLRLDLHHEGEWNTVASCTPVDSSELARLGLRDTGHHAVRMAMHLDRLAEVAGIAHDIEDAPDKEGGQRYATA